MSGITTNQSFISKALEAALKEQLQGINLDDVRLVDANQAAKLFSITPQAFRALTANHFDLGERRTRWSVKELREILEKRKVKKHS